MKQGFIPISIEKYINLHLLIFRFKPIPRSMEQTVVSVLFGRGVAWIPAGVSLMQGSALSCGGVWVSRSLYISD